MPHLFRICTLIAALSLLGSWHRAHSQEGLLGYYNHFVIPDKRFVTDACEQFKTSWYEAYPKSAALCNQYAANKIDGDTWLVAAYSLRLSLSQGGSCRSCSRVILSPTEPVPRGFKAYALFIIPSDTWMEWGDAYFDLELMHRFQDFGDAIGNAKAAIWLQDWNGRIDFNRSKDYADLFGLNYNDGPYVILTSKRPDECKAGDKTLLLKMKGISSGRIKFVLNVMTQQVRLDNSGPSRTLEFEEIRQRVLTFVEGHQDLVSQVVGKILAK